ENPEVIECMPTVLRLGPSRFYFWSHELHEPPHIHVDRDPLSAEFWLRPVRRARNTPGAAQSRSNRPRLNVNLFNIFSPPLWLLHWPQVFARLGARRLVQG